MIYRKIISVILALVSTAAFGQVPISGLPPANLPLQSTDKIVVNQTISGNASTRAAPLSALAPFFPSLTSHYLLQAPDATLTQSRTLAGTANEIILTDGGALANLTLSTPQPIAPASTPTFAGLTLTGPLSGTSASFTGGISSVGYSGTTGVFSSTLSSVGYSGTTGTFTGALSAGSLSLTTPLPATSGGTGFGSYAIGDLLSASTTTALSKISDVAAGSYLRSGGVSTLPLWSTMTLPNAATTGDLLMATGTNAIGVRADVAAGSYLRSAGIGVAPVYSTTTIPNTAVLGDIWYGSAANAISALAGNTTTTKQFLTQTGTGTISATPAWGTISSSDLPGGFTGFANPTGTIGLTAVNGVATTAPRSDSAPALSQAIVPTWTGIHTYAAAAPEIVFDSTGAVADTKNTIIRSLSAGGLSISTATDAAPTTAVKDVLSYARTTTAVTGVTLGNATDKPTTTATGPVSAQGATTGITCNSSTGSNTGANCFSVNVAGHTAWAAVVSPLGGAGNELGFLVDGGTGPNSTDSLLRVAKGGTTLLNISGSGATSLSGGVLAFGELQDNGTTCTLNAVVDNMGIASCSRSSAGVNVITFSNTTGLLYSCTVTLVAANGAPSITARTATTATITTVSLAGTPTDFNFAVTCF